MKLQHDICYRALETRDARFDGQFFTAVRTTGVYCRPICPARTPRPENCDFYSTAAAAQEAGFRSCLRCRPEIAPQLNFEGEAIVNRALRLIQDGEHSLPQIASSIGVTDRHLRRLFTEHLGASPLTVVQTRRILFAKQLLDETRLSVTEVALAAGFQSLRRFNDVMLRTYLRSPRELRRGRDEVPDSSWISLKLAYSPPYDWSSVVGSSLYRRSVEWDGETGEVEVLPVAGHNYLLARIRFPKVQALGPIVERLRRVLDLGANSATIDEHLSRDPRLAPLIRARPGVRVAGDWNRADPPDDGPDGPEHWRPWRAYAAAYLRLENTNAALHR